MFGGEPEIAQDFFARGRGAVVVNTDGGSTIARPSRQPNVDAASIVTRLLIAFGSTLLR